MENLIKKTGAMLLLIMALIGMAHQSNGQEIKKYNKAPQNDKFAGTYIFDDGKQSLVIKLTKKPDVYMKLYLKHNLLKEYLFCGILKRTGTPSTTKTRSLALADTRRGYAY